MARGAARTKQTQRGLSSSSSTHSRNPAKQSTIAPVSTSKDTDCQNNPSLTFADVASSSSSSSSSMLLLVVCWRTVVLSPAKPAPEPASATAAAAIDGDDRTTHLLLEAAINQHKHLPSFLLFPPTIQPLSRLFVCLDNVLCLLTARLAFLETVVCWTPSSTNTSSHIQRDDQDP